MDTVYNGTCATTGFNRKPSALSARGEDDVRPYSCSYGKVLIDEKCAAKNRRGRERRGGPLNTREKRETLESHYRDT